MKLEQLILKGFFEKSVANWRIMLPWCYTASSTKRGRDSCEVWRCFQLSLLPRCVDRDNSARNHWLLIAYSQKVGILSEVASDEKVCIRMTNHTAQKIKFWSNLQRTADLVTLTEEILNGKLHFLRRVLTVTIFIWGSTFSYTIHLFTPLFASAPFVCKYYLQMASGATSLWLFFTIHPFCKWFLPVSFCLSNSWCLSFGAKFSKKYSFLRICSIKRHYLQPQY